ncbi:DUF2306 domain-containing protein [Beijerinckia sp. L45]|uniref:DUF2306 domain-containing protein n=1 Tax=Beijerinckia sp. L45 TaxID=1641855 RepID=UPI00131D6CC4|nr:DUF2306 domain-containing protein [Beijerinckia sp. L45]
MSIATSDQSPRTFRVKTAVFTVIIAMMVYVLYHNEHFLIDAADPIWQHYHTFQWWLLPHGVAGAFALVLAPLQFSDRLRRRYALLHRVIGRIYVAGVIVLAPLGVYIQYLDEAVGASRSFTFAAGFDAVLLLVTTGLGLAFAVARKIPQHRQWMTRSYAVGLAFFEARLILGLAGLDRPPNLAAAEIVVWSCIAMAVLLGDLANQWYDLRSAPPRLGPAR